MEVLLDSHVLLWALFSPHHVGPQTVDLLGAAESVRISTASLWELAITFAKGRLPHSPAQLAAGVEALGAAELSVAHRHLVALPDVDLPHGDPFDTMLIAQSHTDGLTLVTADHLLLASAYDTFDARS